MIFMYMIIWLSLGYINYSLTAENGGTYISSLEKKKNENILYLIKELRYPVSRVSVSTEKSVTVETNADSTLQVKRRLSTELGDSILRVYSLLRRLSNELGDPILQVNRRVSDKLDNSVLRVKRRGSNMIDDGSNNEADNSTKNNQIEDVHYETVNANPIASVLVNPTVPNSGVQVDNVSTQSGNSGYFTLTTTGSVIQNTSDLSSTTLAVQNVTAHSELDLTSGTNSGKASSGRTLVTSRSVSNTYPVSSDSSRIGKSNITDEEGKDPGSTTASFITTESVPTTSPHTPLTTLLDSKSPGQEMLLNATTSPGNVVTPVSGTGTTVAPEETGDASTVSTLNTSENIGALLESINTTIDRTRPASEEPSLTTVSLTSENITLSDDKKIVIQSPAMTTSGSVLKSDTESSTRPSIVNASFQLVNQTNISTVVKTGEITFTAQAGSSTTNARVSMTGIATTVKVMSSDNTKLHPNTTVKPNIPTSKFHFEIHTKDKVINSSPSDTVTTINDTTPELANLISTVTLNNSSVADTVTDSILTQTKTTISSVAATSKSGPVVSSEPPVPEPKSSAEPSSVKQTSKSVPLTSPEPVTLESKSSAEVSSVEQNTEPILMTTHKSPTTKLKSSDEPSSIEQTTKTRQVTSTELTTPELSPTPEPSPVEQTIKIAPMTSPETPALETKSSEHTSVNQTTKLVLVTSPERPAPETKSSEPTSLNQTTKLVLMTNPEPSTPEIKSPIEITTVIQTTKLVPVTSPEHPNPKIKSSPEPASLIQTTELVPMPSPEPPASVPKPSIEATTVIQATKLVPLSSTDPPALTSPETNSVEPTTNQITVTSSAPLSLETKSPEATSGEQITKFAPVTSPEQPRQQTKSSPEATSFEQTTKPAPMASPEPSASDTKSSPKISTPGSESSAEPTSVEQTTKPAPVTNPEPSTSGTQSSPKISTPDSESSAEPTSVEQTTKPAPVTNPEPSATSTQSSKISTDSESSAEPTSVEQTTKPAPVTNPEPSATSTQSSKISTDSESSAEPTSVEQTTKPAPVTSPEPSATSTQSSKISTDSESSAEPTSVEQTTKTAPVTNPEPSTSDTKTSAEPRTAEHTTELEPVPTAEPTVEQRPSTDKPKLNKTSQTELTTGPGLTIETESKAEPEVTVGTEPTAMPEGSDTYPEPESEPDTFAEPAPDWEIAKLEWKEAWQFHIYFFGTLFTLLGLYCLISVIRLWRMEHLLSRHYFLTLNVLVICICIFRAMYLLVDAYNSNGTFPVILNYFLYSTVFPCLTAVFSILFYALLLATRLRVLSPKVQKLWVLIMIILFHFVLSLTTDVVVGLFSSASIMLFICQLFFALWGLVMFIGYLLIFKKLYTVALNRQKALNALSKEKKLNGSMISIQEKKPKQRYTIGLAVKVTFISALFGLACIGFELYGMFGVYGVMYSKKPLPWPWWTYHVIVRTMELLMCACVAYVAAQPLKYTQMKRKSNCIMYCLPCKTLCCQEKINNSIDGEFNSMSMDRYVVSESDHWHWRKKQKHKGKTHSSSKAPYPPHTAEKFKDPNATLLLRKFKQSMLVVEDGFVRIKRQDEVIPMQYQPDCYSGTSGLSSSCASVNGSAVGGPHSSRNSVNVGVGTDSEGITNEGFSQEDVRHRASINLHSCDQISLNRAESVISESNSSEVFRPLSMIDLAVSMDSELEKAFHSSFVDDLELISHNSLPASLERQSSESNEFLNEEVCERYQQMEHDPFSYLESPSFSSDSADNQLQLSNVKLIQTPVRRTKSVDAKTHAKVKLFEKNKYYSVSDIDNISKDDFDGAILKD